MSLKGYNVTKVTYTNAHGGAYLSYDSGIGAPTTVKAIAKNFGHDFQGNNSDEAYYKEHGVEFTPFS